MSDEHVESNGYIDNKMAFQAQAKRDMTEVHVDGIGTVIIQSLTMQEVMACADDPAKQIAYSVVDRDGDRIFMPDNDADLSTIRQLPARFHFPLQTEINRFNGFDAISVERTEKN